MSENSKSTYRVPYLDYLRIVATFAIVLLHVSSSNWDSLTLHNPDLTGYAFWNTLSRWAVPVFIMISGALFLD